MKCNKCGNYVDNDNISFCPTCGSLLQSNVEVPVIEKKKENKFGLGHLIIILIWVLGIAFVFFISKNDFYIDNKYLLEFDGIQHFFANHGWNSEDHLSKVQERDAIKNQWCKNNNIPLIRINYKQLKELKIEDLLL